MSQPRAHSAGKISFSWEMKPGVSKVPHCEQEFLPKLPLPPCTPEATTVRNSSVHDLQIPLPPCAFERPYYRTSAKRVLWVQDDDPFLVAYKKCTKNEQSAERNNKLTKTGFQSMLRKSMSFLSCKRSCAVRDNDFVRISNLPQNVDGD